MSKVAFLNVSAPGHVYPTFGLVRALVDQGEEVVYFEIPRFQSEIEAFGAKFQAYPDQTGYPGRPGVNQIALTSALAWSAQDYLPKVLKLIKQHNPDYIIHDSLCLWGKIAAKILNIPAVCTIASAAFNHESLYECPIFNKYSPKMYADAKEELKLFDKFTEVLDEKYETGPISLLETFTNPEGLNICFLPRELQPYVDCFDDSYKFVGPCDPDRDMTFDFPMDRLEGRSVILISMGTLHSAGIGFYKDCIQAFTGSDHMVVMILSRGMKAGDFFNVPDNFILREPGTVPQLEVLKKASLFIMHAGGGAARESALYGVPVISIPQTYEQELIANRIKEEGAGIILRMGQIDADAIQQNAQLILSDENFRTNMQRLSDSTIKAGGANKAVAEILDYMKTEIASELTQV